jgi:hypothetical protein
VWLLAILFGHVFKAGLSETASLEVAVCRPSRRTVDELWDGLTFSPNALGVIQVKVGNEIARMAVGWFKNTATVEVLN